MATATYYFSGEAEWAKLITPDADFDKSKSSWKVNLIFDDASLKLFENSGLGLKLKKKEDGRYFTTFRRPTKSVIKGEIVEWEAPTLVKEDNSPRASEPVADGSKVTLKVVVYDSMKGKGHRLESVRVDKEGTGNTSGGTVLVADDVVPF